MPHMPAKNPSQRALDAARLTYEGVSVAEAARRVGVSRETVTHARRVLRNGDDEVIAAIERGAMRVSSPTTARPALSSIAISSAQHARLLVLSKRARVSIRRIVAVALDEWIAGAERVIDPERAP